MGRMHRLGSFSLLALLASMAVAAGADAPDEAADPYLRYVNTAPEFQPVRQDPAFLIGRWNTWIYMPWRYHWTIGTGDAGGRFCREFGFNGGFTDRGEGPLDWLERWNLRFYNDHTAGKGDLHLRGSENKSNFQPDQRNPRAIRHGTDGPRPIDAGLRRRLRDRVAASIAPLRASRLRVAYALDDEISWGAFVTPLPWRINGDDAAYEHWLDTYYGGRAPQAALVTPDFALGQLDHRLGQLDFSPLLDRLSYQDSVWANLIRELVEHANRIDPETPCGFVGGQAPSTWGGYDYAKLAKAIQFIEAYDLGSAQAILRSFNPGNAWAQVTTHFHNDQYREEGTDTDAHRATFLRQINASGRPPRVVVRHQGRRPPQCEVTYWSKAGRTFVFILRNVPVNATTTGGGGAAGLSSQAMTLDVELPAARKVVDERTGKALGEGKVFSFRWSGVEPVFFSY